MKDISSSGEVSQKPEEGVIECQVIRNFEFDPEQIQRKRILADSRKLTAKPHDKKTSSSSLIHIVTQEYLLRARLDKW